MCVRACVCVCVCVAETDVISQKTSVSSVLKGARYAKLCTWQKYDVFVCLHTCVYVR